MGTNYAIEVQGLSKSFGAIDAVQDVSLGMPENEVMALMGDNGAGKSTFIKMLSGVITPDSGSIYIEDEEVSLSSHEDARAHGIETVYQDLALAPNRTVWENLFLGKEIKSDGVLGSVFNWLDDDRMIRESRRVLTELGMDMDPQDVIKNMSGGQQQAVAIARAIQSDPKIVIMDEPTSALSVEAAEEILELIETLKKQGITIILIDHNIDEVFRVADRMAVLASGQLMGIRSKQQLTEDQVIQMMMGEKISTSA